ncbi:MAG: endonuclease VII domain-containing protein [Actinobacteria bacterium]|nr:endonuclease VII domain-containing protein [Actinomycetota bacterium]
MPYKDPKDQQAWTRREALRVEAAGQKRCSRCKETKSVDLFHRAGRSGRQPYCKPCATAYERAKYPNGKPNRRRTYLKHKYGMTPESYTVMLEDQGGRCAICCTLPNRFVVDHNHANGKIRGILCDTCNRALGLLKDNADVLRKAAAYVDGGG